MTLKLLNLSLWDKIKIVFKITFGSAESILEAALVWFNSSVLGKVKSAEEAGLYCKDVKDFAFFLRSVLARHSDQWPVSGAKRKAFLAVVDAVDCLAAALEDLEVTKEELSSLVEHVRKAIKAWKEA